MGRPPESSKPGCRQPDRAVTLAPMSRSPWPLQQDGLLLRDAVEADIEALQSFRNDTGVNHFMVRTHVDPDDLRRDWLSVPDSPTDYSCSVERGGDVVAMGFLDIVDGAGQPGRGARARGDAQGGPRGPGAVAPGARVAGRGGVRAAR